MLNTKKKKLQISLSLEDKQTHNACTGRWTSQLSQGWQSGRTEALSKTLACKSKMLKHPKPDILQYTYPKYTTNLSVSTLSTQKKVCVGWGRGGRETEAVFAKTSLMLLEMGMAG